MVSRNRKVIADFVHDIHNVAAVRKSPYGCALDGIAGIQKEHVRRLRFHLLLIERHAGITDPVFNAAVDVVGVQDYNVLVGRKGRACREQHKERG